MDEANRLQKSTKPHRQRGQQHDNACPPANLNSMENFRFAGEFEDRTPPLPRETYEQTSVVDHGRQSTPVSRPAASHLSTTTSVTSSDRSCTMPATSSSSATPVTIGSAPVTIQWEILIEYSSEVGASADPLLEYWGLPQPDTVINQGINSWVE